MAWHPIVALLASFSMSAAVTIFQQLHGLLGVSLSLGWSAASFGLQAAGRNALLSPASTTDRAYGSGVRGLRMLYFLSLFRLCT